MRSSLIIIILSVLLYGCADTSKIQQDPVYANFSIEKESSVYISLPKDGRYGDKLYKGSGQTVTNIIRSSLLQFIMQADVASSFENYKNAISAAEEQGYDYLFFATILHWEDRATEWSGISDKADIKIVVIDINTLEVKSSATIMGSSGLATFGGDHPQDLLPTPVAEYINAFFR